MRFKDKLCCDNCGKVLEKNKKIEKEQTERRKEGKGYNLLVQCEECKKSRDMKIKDIKFNEEYLSLKVEFEHNNKKGT